jgi:hypothetical protein
MVNNPTSPFVEGQSTPPDPFNDLTGSTQAHAHQLAAHISQYWANRGREITVRVDRDARGTWVVRTNLFQNAARVTARPNGGQS